MITAKTPRYPNAFVQLDLSGPDGNAFMVLGAVNKALTVEGISQEERVRFNDQARSGDYQNLLRVCSEWVNFKPLNGDVIL